VIVETRVSPENQNSPVEAVPDSPQEDFTTVAVPVVE
jgi:hypothetical protein